MSARICGGPRRARRERGPEALRRSTALPASSGRGGRGRLGDRAQDARRKMKHLALSLLALASTLTAQQWPFNLEPKAPFMDVAVDPVQGAPLLLLGLVTDGCGGGTRNEELVNGRTAYSHPVGTRVRLHARTLLWHDSRRCSDGEVALITWSGGYGSGSIALRHTAPTSMVAR